MAERLHHGAPLRRPAASKALLRLPPPAPRAKMLARPGRAQGRSGSAQEARMALTICATIAITIVVLCTGLA